MDGFNYSIISRLLQYVYEQQRDWNTYLLPLEYAHNVQAYRAITVSPCSSVLTWTPLRPATVVPKRISLASDDDTASPTYAKTGINKGSYRSPTRSWKEVKADKTAIQKELRPTCPLHPIFPIWWLLIPRQSTTNPLFRKMVRFTRLKELLPRMQGSYEVANVAGRPYKILQDGLKDSISIHRATLVTMPMQR